MRFYTNLEKHRKKRNEGDEGHDGSGERARGDTDELDVLERAGVGREREVGRGVARATAADLVLALVDDGS